MSPSAGVTYSVGDRFRASATASRRSVAPGAEEFLPPGDTGIWLPPQRTFSALASGGQMSAAPFPLPGARGATVTGMGGKGGFAARSGCSVLC